MKALTKSELRKYAFRKSIPIMCSYVFVAMTYGMMMQEAGFEWFESLFVSMTVYTGAFQFVLITFLSSGASLLTVAVTAFLMNSRQVFYGLSFVSKFPAQGWKRWYMIHTMSDETYAVNCSLELPKEEADEVMFYVALFSRIYWMCGSVLGGIAGQLRRLGDMLPSAIMAVLIIYCLKDVGDDFMEDGLWRLAAVGVVAVTYKWKHQTLLSIVSGTVFYMVLLAVV